MNRPTSQGNGKWGKQSSEASRHLLLKHSPGFGRSARAQEVCESRSGRPGLPVPNKPTVSVDVKQHFTIFGLSARAQEMCESRSGRPGLPVPNKPTVSVDVKQH